MKKLVMIVLLLAAVWLGINYVRTGRLTLAPSTMSEEERRVADLEEELARVKAQIAQAGRSASMAGLDTTADVDSLIKRKEALEKELAEARGKLP